ncbi:hypothetical protein SISNIDRAFT_398639, partial [Sistotremastrum niveocremeum HHB9708]
LLVCRQWNEVACSTPGLWSQIVVSNTHSIEKARRKLIRSKSVPLDITITFSPRLNGSSAGEPVMRAVEMLRPSIPRWRTFRLRVPNRVHAHTALKLCTKDKAPLLEGLSIQISNAMQDDAYTSPPVSLFKGHTPRLISCSLTSFNFEWDRNLASGLRVLRLGGYWNGYAPTGRQLRDIIKGCPMLEELNLRNMSDLDPECDDLVLSTTHKPQSLIHLPRLHTLSFYYSGIIRTTLLLSGISFPSVRKIEFAYLDDITPAFKAIKRQCFSLVTDSNHPLGLPLDTLRIEGCFFNELKFMRLLRRVPTLTTLELIEVEDVSSNLLKGLSTPPQAQQWIVPQMESLSLEGCTSTSLDWDALSTLVESRIPSRSMTRQQNARSYASVSAMNEEHGINRIGAPGDYGPPKRLRMLDLTKCTQINREQLEWLRMYVQEVRSESSRSVWVE